MLRRAVKCVLASAFFAFLHWLWGVIANKDNAFLKPFLVGALSLFVVFTLINLASFIVTYIRLKRNPEFMDMNIRYNGALKWSDYKRMKKGK